MFFNPDATKTSTRSDVFKEVSITLSSSLFKASILKMGRTHANVTYRIHNPIGIRLLMRLHLALCHHNKHKFRNNFADCVSPLCCGSIKPKSTFHFFLQCHNFLNIRRKHLIR